MTFGNAVHTGLRNYPWLVASTEGKICGYAYANAHRFRAAYRWSAEVSVYVDPDYHRRGVARMLYNALFENLQEQHICMALAGIVLPNDKSEHFHRSMGFEDVGVYHKIGYKAGAWRDVKWLQKAIIHRDTPGTFRAFADLTKKM